MKVISSSQNYTLVFQKGEKLVQSLLDFALDYKIKAAWLSGIGGALGVELGFYDLDSKQYNWRAFDEVMEITGLYGDLISQDGKPIFHIHGTFARSDFSCIGGHIKDLTVGGTLELQVQPFEPDSNMRRSFDDQTGLNLLDVQV